MRFKLLADKVIWSAGFCIATMLAAKSLFHGRPLRRAHQLGQFLKDGSCGIDVPQVKEGIEARSLMS